MNQFSSSVQASSADDFDNIGNVPPFDDNIGYQPNIEDVFAAAVASVEAARSASDGNEPPSDDEDEIIPNIFTDSEAELKHELATCQASAERLAASEAELKHQLSACQAKLKDTQEKLVSTQRRCDGWINQYHLFVNTVADRSSKSVERSSCIGCDILQEKLQKADNQVNALIAQQESRTPQAVTNHCCTAVQTLQKSERPLDDAQKQRDDHARQLELVQAMADQHL